MKRNQPTYSVFQSGSAVFMMLALLWLTISAPFIYASQQQLIKAGIIAGGDNPFTAAEEETSKSVDTSTEEKTPSNPFAEEYLHHHHTEEFFSSSISRYHKLENAGAYIAFHGELLVPPPDFS
ncbi:MAG TPA: hypothetical protein VEY06_09255 [Flavisolibacter sp.]|jgi:hypothetical protein|nr:hypothetical protein [Flavisolibacter sp.]